MNAAVKCFENRAAYFATLASHTSQMFISVIPFCLRCIHRRKNELHLWKSISQIRAKNEFIYSTLITNITITFKVSILDSTLNSYFSASQPHKYLPEV